MNWFFAAAALALLLWFFALLYLKSFVRQRTSPDHILGLLQEEIRQLEADIDEKTERDLQLLEDKIQALREICTEAERRIAIYGRELEKREKETQALAVLERSRGVLAPPPKLAGQARSEPLKIVVSPESPLVKQPVVKQPLVVKQPSLKDRIAELYRAGFSPELIAKQLGLTAGEVTLYINMVKKPYPVGKQKRRS
jgi:septal ring factor EnvC (AmiA/AmiB activator)